MSAPESPTPLQPSLVHAVCERIRMAGDEPDCEKCPARVEVPGHGDGTPGCYHIADGICELVASVVRSEKKRLDDYPPQHANADGWTDWISPTDIDMYGMQCCDCGLKHEMQFRVMRNKAYTDGEHWFADPVPVEEGYHVAFRMKRDAESVSTGVQSANTSIEKAMRLLKQAAERIAATIAADDDGRTDPLLAGIHSFLNAADSWKVTE